MRLNQEQIAELQHSFVQTNNSPLSLLEISNPWSSPEHIPCVQTNVRSRFFASAERLLSELDNIFTSILALHDRTATSRLLDFTSRVQLTINQDSEAFLASLELFQGAHYALLHALHSATLCELVSRSMNFTEDNRRRLMAAALTRDLGFYGLQEIFDHQNSRLAPHQIRQLHWHPRISRYILEQAGVTDQNWLLAVEQHHERLDGSGYPEGALDEAIHPWSRILGITDIYSAMTKRRCYREAIQGSGALQELFTHRGAQVDSGITARFISIVGIYPPGTFVRLANGEIAVITRMGQNPKYPQLKAVANKEGHLYPIAIAHDSAEPPFAITEMIPKGNNLTGRINHRQLWGDPQKIQLKSSFPL